MALLDLLMQIKISKNFETRSMLLNQITNDHKDLFRLRFFILNDDQFMVDMISNVQVKEYSKHQFIQKQNDHSMNEFLIIAKGHIGFIQEFNCTHQQQRNAKEQKEFLEKQIQQIDCVYQEGQTLNEKLLFEPAILNNNTLLTLSNCTVFHISRKSFRPFLQKQDLLSKEEIIKKYCPLYSKIDSTYQLYMILFSFTDIKYSNGFQICTQNSNDQKIYLVLSGQLELYKQIYVRCKVSHQEQQITIPVCQIGQFQLVGEEILNARNNYFYDCKVLTAECQLYEINLQNIKDYFSKEMKQKIYSKFLDKENNRENYIKQIMKKQQNTLEYIQEQPQVKNTLTQFYNKNAKVIENKKLKIPVQDWNNHKSLFFSRLERELVPSSNQEYITSKDPARKVLTTKTYNKNIIKKIFQNHKYLISNKKKNYSVLQTKFDFGKKNIFLERQAMVALEQLPQKQLIICKQINIFFLYQKTQSFQITRNIQNINIYSQQ